MKMNPEIKERWVAALKSGKYQQGKGALRGLDGGYCCLGVLCDVIDPSGWKKAKAGDEHGYYHEGHWSLPDVTIFERAGFTREGGSGVPKVQIGDKTASLDAWNDGGKGIEPKSFAEIAEAIQEQL